MQARSSIPDCFFNSREHKRSRLFKVGLRVLVCACAHVVICLHLLRSPGQCDKENKQTKTNNVYALPSALLSHPHERYSSCLGCVDLVARARSARAFRCCSSPLTKSIVSALKTRERFEKQAMNTSSLNNNARRTRRVTREMGMDACARAPLVPLPTLLPSVVAI